ncbi:MAG: class I SAM-dependent methyltransferase, partial [Slackia isoflavoniconvertens]|nr:class I SAM-dependent methyltransferase [Slackia isoflavoniconvertens]
EPCDLVGCFGFFHHVPSFGLRVRLIEALLQKAASGGVVCASFWQFMGDEKFVKKAEAWNSKAKSELASAGLDASQLEAGDYFLGWQNEPGLWRYCHHFEELEIDALVAAACEGGKVRDVARFSADGKSGAMNRYVVLQKR